MSVRRDPDAIEEDEILEELSEDALDPNLCPECGHEMQGDYCPHCGYTEEGLWPGDVP